METERAVKQQNYFLYSERLIVELFLLTYIFIFFIGETVPGTQYIWIALSIIGGILAYFIFRNRTFTVGMGIVIALAITVPLFLFGAPFTNVVVFFLYAFWRIRANFDGSRIKGWPFLFINSIVFLFLYMLARTIFVYNDPQPLLLQQLIIFIITSFLYYAIRLVTIAVNSYELKNFDAGEAGKVFAKIMGYGLAAFIAGFLIIKYIRTAITVAMAFVLNTFFNLSGKLVDPLLDKLFEPGEKLPEEEADFSVIDFEMEEERTVWGMKSDVFEVTFQVMLLLIVIGIAILIFRKATKRFVAEDGGSYFFTAKGKREQNTGNRQDYDYSEAANEIRRSFENFEKEAQQAKMPRMKGETIAEWFKRMKWSHNQSVLQLYNDARYGKLTADQAALDEFKTELNSIKETFLNK